jgi:Auxiliary Activity family 9 (formerly GH61)
MKSTTLFSALAAAAGAAAHGIVSDLKVDGKWYTGYMVFQDRYMSPLPERIVWSFPEAGNGPVEDVSSTAITCNKGATTPAKLVAPAAAGSDVSFYWTTWPGKLPKFHI